MTNLAELDMYLERLCDTLGHADRRISLKDPGTCGNYCTRPRSGQYYSSYSGAKSYRCR